MYFLGGMAILALVLIAYVRLAPSHHDRWHVTPEVKTDKTFKNGAVRIVPAGADGLRRFDTITATDPRTEILAGTVESGMITYISRSRLIGFPDYTTVMQVGEDLMIFARSRFGRRDFGVNAARVDGWIDALTAY